MAEENIIRYVDGGNDNVKFISGADAVTVAGIDLTSAKYDFLNGLSDLGINWTVNNGVIEITGNANPKDMIPVAQEVKQVPEVTPQHNSTGLVGAIKENNNNTSSLLNQQNVILDNHSKLLKESNDINRVLAEQMIRANDISAMTAATISTSFDRLIELKRVENASNIYNSYIQEDMVNVLNKSAVATKALSDSQVQTNTKISQGVDSQVVTNSKTNEHYDYQKSGEVTDSDGTKYSPREIQAKANAEHHLEKKDSNEFDWKEFFLYTLGDSDNPNDTIDDDLETSLLDLLEHLKTAPLETFDRIDNAKYLTRKETV